VRDLAGRTVTSVSAHGKHLVIELDSGTELRAHLGMYGRQQSFDRAGLRFDFTSRTFYGDVLGFEILPLDRLHSPEDEALWGLPAARRDGFVAKGAGDVLIEVLCYSAPQGRPKPDDYLISDQGIMNLALGSRSVDEVSATLDRLALEGLVPPFVVRSGSNICGYIVDRERELEFAGYPEGADDLYGFAPARIDFFGAAIG